MRHHADCEFLSSQVIGAFFAVYNRLRSGYLEQVYVNALSVELRHRELAFEREKAIQVLYRSEVVGQYRADLVVGGCLIVEVKAGMLLDDSARWQTLNYLRATGMPLGLLLHFGAEPSFQRIVASRTSISPTEFRRREERSP